MEGGDRRVYQKFQQCPWILAIESPYKGFKALGGVYDGIWLLVFIRTGLSRIVAGLLGFQLISDVSPGRVFSR